MSGILLTQDSGKLLGPIARLLGHIMEFIFNALDAIGIPNIGLSIIIFTIVIYLLMMPLTIKQQKFSKLSAKMNPELQAIQKKYKNKKDNDSMMAMNQETQAVYAKYGVSPTGSCVQLIIQMPILFALYRVIYAMPAYVTKIKDAFYPLVEKLRGNDAAVEYVKGLQNSMMYTKQFNNELFTGGNVQYIENTMIDCLNRASTAEWNGLSEQFSSLSADVSMTLEKLNEYNNFLGLNMANSPSFTMKDAFSTGNYLLVVGALLIPLLAAFTQWMNTKLMPQANANSGNETADSMAQSMKMMNTMMPIMSAFFCFTLPAGMGLYWIAGAVVRSIQQVMINRHIDKMDINDVIKKNESKAAKKIERMKASYDNVSNYAAMKTKGVNDKASYVNTANKEEALKKANDYYSKNAKPGSIAAKANMVKEYNEKNSR